MGSKSFTNKVVGIFNDRSVVDSVLNELNNSGFERDDISVLARDYDENSDRIVTHGGTSTAYPDTDIRRSTLVDDTYTSGSDLRRDSLVDDNYVPGTYQGNTYPTGSMGGPVTNSMGSTISNVGNTLRDTGRNIKDSVTDRNLIQDNNNFDNTHEVMEKDPKAMIKGATAGGALGLIAGIGLLMIPGIGPVLAAGPLAATITAAAGGAAIGATAGTLLGLLKDEGVPSDRADFYNRHFNKGDVLVMVHTDEGRSTLAREILVRFNPDTIDTF